MTERYPGYDVMTKQWSPSWNEITRKVVNARLAVPREPRFFTADEWRTLQAVCARIMPQPADGPQIPLPAYVDAKITDKHEDGYRYAELPHQGEAWQRGLAALDQEAHGGRFHALPPEVQDDLLRRMQQGELKSAAWGGMPCKPFFEHRVIADITHAYYAHPVAWNEIGFGGPASPRGYVRMGLNAWGGMPCKPFFEHRVIADITHAYYAHPVAWNEIGFGGPASPRGYVRMGLNRRDPWEAAEAHPGEEAKARRENSRVG